MNEMNEMNEPRTWTDEEIVLLMTTEARIFAAHQKTKHWIYKEMMQHVLQALRENNLLSPFCEDKRL